MKNVYCDKPGQENRRRRYRKGDLVCITGYLGDLFWNGKGLKLGKNIELGHQVTLTRDENCYSEVCLPEGVLADGFTWLHADCIELIKPCEDREANNENS